MDVFTDVYSKWVELLKTSPLDPAWSGIQAKCKELLPPDGPNDAKETVLDELRAKLIEAGKRKAKPAEAAAEEILKASRAGNAGFQDRAAMLKALRHFYLVRKKGNQSIWVVDGPKAYGQWTFDLFAGQSAIDLKATLQRESEVFGGGNRKMMSDALQLARKWSSDIQAKLSDPDDRALRVVKRWFHDAAASEAELKASAVTLHAGFKKIAAECNSTRVVFSDRPHKRANGTYDSTFASVNAGDAMPVIYIFKLFLEAGRRNRLGKIGKLWLCALTIIHELSHKKVGTDDIQYDDDGLKPGAGFTTSQALDNADSWGYFAADMVGALPKKTFSSVYK